MNSFESQRQESMKRRWLERMLPSPTPSPLMSNPNNNLRHFFGGFEDDLVSSVVPPVTVVLEGRSLCHRISLDKHTSYQSLANALRQMFVDGGDHADNHQLDLSNAVPGHLIAYEDMENDLLLVGDLNWKDFVRVARRIRVLPVKANSRKRREGD